MLKAKKADILHGNLFVNILRYGIPVIFIGLIQSLFNAVDIMVLSKVSDDVSVASVGAPSTLITLFVTFFFGLSAGVKIILARYIGANDEDKVKKTVSTAVISAFFIGVVIAIAAFFTAYPFLKITNCPTECIDGAALYMRIYLAGAPMIMLYNFGSAIISSTGDSQRPLYYMIISGSLNVVLNFALCLIMPQKVAAVAIATVVSQSAGAFCVIYRLCKMSGICRLNIHNLKWSASAFRGIIVNGAPIGLTNALYPIANLQIRAQINSFGAAAIAGDSAMVSMESIVSSISHAPWASTLSVFVSQNIGAKQYDRVKKSIAYNLIIAALLASVIGVLGVIFSRQILSLYVSEEASILYAQTRMMYTLLFNAIGALNGVFAHAIQSFGYATFSSANSIISVFGFRILWMNLIYPINPTYGMLTQCYLVSWILTFIVNIMVFSYLYFAKFKKHKLKIMQ